MNDQDDRKQISDALCDVIAASIPSARRTIKWNAPNFEIKGIDLITLNFSPKNPVRVVFHRGAKAIDTKSGKRLVADESGRLTWATDQRAYVSFSDLSTVREATPWLTGFCRKWVDQAGTQPR
jgi:hypothetical protein